MWTLITKKESIQLNNMEKTFEELIEKYTFYDRSDYAKKEPLLDKVDVLQLLQQVREATIAEVLKLCDDNFFSKEPDGKLMENIENLPTDIIKIKE